MSESRRKRYSAGPKSRPDNIDNQYGNSGNGNSTAHRHKNTHIIGRMTSYDRVRKIVQEEGRTARNLVQYSVPLANSSHGERSSRSLIRQTRKSRHEIRMLLSGGLPRVLSVDSHLANRMPGDMTKSPKSDSGRKPDLRARYWKFLFDNLQRAVDAIYETCEQDESVVECKEVIMMLDQSARDFRLLIERLDMLRAYEESAKDGDRPTAIAWEVRKMSPGKMTNHSVHSRCSPSPAQRVLNFSGPSSQLSSLSQSRNEDNSTHKSVTPPPKIVGNSWADRVKGIGGTVCHPKPVRPSTNTDLLTSDSSLDTHDAEDGWETVQRGGKTKAKNSPSQKSLENLTIQKNNDNIRADLYHSKSVQDSAVPKPQISKDSVGSSTEKIGEDNQPSTRNKKTAAGNKKTESNSLTPGTQGIKTTSPKPKDTKKTKSNLSGNVKSNSTGNQNSKSNGNDQSTTVSKTNSTSASINSGAPKSGNASNTGSGGTAKESANSKSSSSGSSGTKKNANETSNVGAKKGIRARDTGKNSKTMKRNLTSSPVNSKPDVKTLKDIPARKTDKKRSKDPNEIEKTMNTLKAALSQTSLHSGADDKDNDDELAQQLDTALACAQDAEDSLSSQLEEEQQQALESAIEEEETWLKELARTASTEIDVDTESELTETITSLESSQPTLDWETLEAEYDEKVQRPWSDMVEEAEERTPGHGVHMHEKLSSPSRKRSPTESRRRHEEKQAKAQELREKLMQEKAERLRELSKKVEEVRAWKEELMKQRKQTMERKLQRAEEKRQSQLRLKSRKAHDEETKANEIAFINSLEAQNKRHEILSKHQESEARLKEQAEEKLRKMEEKKAKEAAVEERRRALEADRKAKLVEMQERRKMRDARIEHEREESKKERHEALKAKEREQKERMAALNAQQEAHIQELQKKIQQKQDESSLRHEEVLNQIREKAFEMSIYKHSTEDHNDAPQLTLYDKKKLCKICNTLIPSEVYLLSHLRGKKHQQSLKDNNSGQDMSNEQIEKFNLKNIVDVPDNSNHPKLVTEKERLKSMKKRCKKLRIRMISRGVEYENALSNKAQVQESTHKAKINKIIKDLSKLNQNNDTGPWLKNKVQAIDKSIGELRRILEKKEAADLNNFRTLGCTAHLSKMLSNIDDATPALPCVVPNRLLIHACEVYRVACKGSYENSHYMLFSNKIGQLVDHLIHRLTMIIPDGEPRPNSPTGTGQQNLPSDPVAGNLMQLIATILTRLAKNNPTTKCSEASIERMSSSGDAFVNRGNDFISYIVSVGVIDKLRQFFSSVRGPIDDNKDAAEFLLQSLGLLIAMTKFMSKRNNNVFDKNKADDPSQLIATFEVTELVGIVTLLYGMLLYSGAPIRGELSPPDLPQNTLTITITGLRMLNHMAALDLNMLQKGLGEEGISLEFRHIASYLMWYCSHQSNEELLHEVLICVGNFTALHSDNQAIIQSGQPPTVLQQLCVLPFEYFSDQRLTAILFPTLIACCYNNSLNREILEQELSCALLSNFIEEKILEAQQQGLSPSSGNKKSKNQEKQTLASGDSDNRINLGNRFPQNLWQEAQNYFS